MLISIILSSSPHHNYFFFQYDKQQNTVFQMTNRHSIYMNIQARKREKKVHDYDQTKKKRRTI